MKYVGTLLFSLLMLMCAFARSHEDVPSWVHSIVSPSPNENHDTSHTRKKRSIFNFQSIIQCVQPWINALSKYGDYGCYCGYKGHGQPLDDTDKCCFFHDKCYDDAESQLQTFTEMAVGSYFTDYNFECINNKVVCLTEQNNAYQQSFCDCDRRAAECFLKNRRSYTSKLFNIDTGKYCVEKPNFEDIHLHHHTLSQLYTCQMQPEHDRCCVDEGYNSAYQICCGGKIRSRPLMKKESVRCCGGRFYDVQLRMCCFGVLHPNALHMECCGNRGAKVDTTIAECIDGNPVLLSKRKNRSNSTVIPETL